LFLCACEYVIVIRQRASAVPRFGVWDEQTASSAAQGFTVQFENVKRNREVARSGVPAVPRVPSPPEGAALRRAHQKTPFVSKVRTWNHACWYIYTVVWLWRPWHFADQR
jgi:hypothetical protein